MDVLKPPMQVSFTTSNVAENWRRFERQFRVYYAACELQLKPKATQVGILLHTAGAEAQDVHETIEYALDDDKADYELVLTKFRTYCEPRKNIVFERYQFWGRNQNQDEPVDQWVTDLRTKAAKCEFRDQESDMIRDKIVFGVHDTRIKERLLREADLTLARALDVCRAAETSKHQMDAMGTAHAQIHAVHTQKHARTTRKPMIKPPANSKRESTCQYCGQTHAPRQCPAFGKVCKKCSGMNHFAVVCRGGGNRKPGGRPVHSVESDDTSGLFIGTVFVGGINCNEWQTTLRLNNSDVIFKLDTGADANVLPLDVYQQIYSNVPLTPTDTILTAFGDNKIRPEGEVQLEVTCPRTSMTKLLHFYVTRASSIAILGCKACTTMNLVKRVAIGIVEDTTVLTEAGLR